MQRFGSDKPDLRIEGMELKDLSPALTETTFAPFASALGAGGEVRGLVVRGGATMSRKTLDELQEFAKRYGAGALAWIKLGDELSSSLLKALGNETVTRIGGAATASKGDGVLIVAGKMKWLDARSLFLTRCSRLSGSLSFRCLNFTKTMAAITRCIIRSPRLWMKTFPCSNAR